mmetsp:Transcript_17243/g.38038  ORF Transcript_17243/g.38038 Transcript_17243/m.38038 type:complete len:231 (-) Transcript_17243:90-782(-)
MKMKAARMRAARPLRRRLCSLLVQHGLGQPSPIWRMRLLQSSSKERFWTPLAVVALLHPRLRWTIWTLWMPLGSSRHNIHGPLRYDDTVDKAAELVLGFHGEATKELDAHRWSSEDCMWRDIISALSDSSPDGDVGTLRVHGRNALQQSCTEELLFVVHNCPGKEQAEQFPSALRCVATLVANIAEVWASLEQLRPDDLGQIAVVLAGVGIGKKLKAGKQKFPIETLPDP